VPPGLTLQELDIIKLTAQYVARNGAEFLSGLRSREDNKREFMFLKETHSLNTFFKRLTDAYSSVLLDSREALKQLNADAMDSSAILQRCASSKGDPRLCSCNPVPSNLGDLGSQVVVSFTLSVAPPALACVSISCHLGSRPGMTGAPSCVSDRVCFDSVQLLATA
jgi:hypothetical protein